jgi:ribosomal-protein-alanine N-acetyltransferase
MDITLRLWEKHDAKRVYELVNNEKIVRNLRDYIPFPYTLEDAHAFIKDCLAKDPSQAIIRCVCVNGEAAGSIGVLRFSDVYRRSAEIGYWIGEPYWGKGAATASVKIICGEVFLSTDIVRIEAGVFSWNAASMRVLEKSGFSFEGILRRSVYKNNTFGDQHVYALIRDH